MTMKLNMQRFEKTAFSRITTNKDLCKHAHQHSTNKAILRYWRPKRYTCYMYINFPDYVHNQSASEVPGLKNKNNLRTEFSASKPRWIF